MKVKEPKKQRTPNWVEDCFGRAVKYLQESWFQKKTKSPRRRPRINRTHRPDFTLTEIIDKNNKKVYPQLEEMAKRYPATLEIDPAHVAGAIVLCEGNLKEAAQLLRDEGYDIPRYKTPQN